MSTETGRSQWMLVSRVVLYLVTAIFLGKTLIAGWGEVAAFDWHWSPVHLLIVALILMLCSLSQAVLWTWLARRAGAQLDYRRGTQAYLLAHLARYIPGGVWPFAQMAVAAQDAGSSSVLFSGLLIVLQVSVAAACALLALPLVPGLLGISSGPLAVLLSVGLAAAVLVCPWLVKVSLGRVSSWRAFSSLVVVEERLPARTYFQLFLGVWVLQVISSCGFVVFVAAQVEIEAPQALLLITAWNAAWLGGYLAIPVPMGLGVRESLLALLLGPMVAGSLGAAIAVLYRLFTVATELALLVLAAALGAGHERPTR